MTQGPEYNEGVSSENLRGKSTPTEGRALAKALRQEPISCSRTDEETRALAAEEGKGKVIGTRVRGRVGHRAHKAW